MGVPAFFRWLCRKYPSVIAYCVEEKKKEIAGILLPVDSSQPNPNGVEFDNLYLDMNGIIHPCTHPEDKPPPKNEDEMMVAIFDCIDRLFAIVRPRKLLYMAIDGVAPRAKMNQQRSRRFRASKESEEKLQEIGKVRAELLTKGAILPPEKSKDSHFDSNCITPGTAFMDRLSKCLHYYIHDRLNYDPGWKGVKVILSDANVPGEGEHKIMDFIRRQRAQPDHDPNTQHCLCGADADLIMLGLATHEPYFTIIREEFRPNKQKPCEICNQVGHEIRDCVGCPKPTEGAAEESLVVGEEIPFIFVRLNVLREYLERDLQMPNLPFPYDFERVIDDWVFMCFFVGNDFLPHLPSLEIREGAIDRLVTLYKSCVYKTRGFLTESGTVNLNCVQIILNELGKVEDEIFKKRQQMKMMFKQREKNKKKLAMQNKDGRPMWILGGQYNPSAVGSGPNVITDPRQEAFKGRVQGAMRNVALESFLRADSQLSSPSSVDSDNPGNKRELQEDSSDEEVHDEVRLWEEGFKDRYYESKFDVGKSEIGFRTRVAHEYVRGLCWVLKYYYQGCASWKWFFPYHYAPFASDFVDIASVNTNFERGTQPFKPLEQLMGVFPAASSSHIPKPWQQLMHDPNSPIIDFYPVDFKIDLNGKNFAWQGVALLPFVDENRLFKALRPYYDQLTPAERKRNIRGDDRVYVGKTNKGHSFLKGLYDKPFFQQSLDEEFEICFDGMRGTVLPSGDCVDFMGSLASPVKTLPIVKDNFVVCARFRDPTYSADFIFQSRRLRGAVEPVRVLKPSDLTLEQNRNWRPQLGMAQRNQRASIEQSGSRALEFYSRSAQRHNQNTGESGGKLQRGIYSQVPPPSAIPLISQLNIPQPLLSYGYHTAQGSSGYSQQNRNYDQRFRDNRGGGSYQNIRGYSGNQNRQSSDNDNKGNNRGSNRGYEQQRQGSNDQRRQNYRTDRNIDPNGDRNYNRNRDRNFDQNRDRNFDQNRDRNFDQNRDRNFDQNRDWNEDYNRARGTGYNQYGRGSNRGGYRGNR